MNPVVAYLRRGVAIGRTLLLPLALLAGSTIFLLVVHRHYPIQHWLFWVYAKIWLWCAAFALSCLALGNVITNLLLKPSFPLRERVVFALATGLLGNFYLLFVLGLLRLYNPWVSAAFAPIVVAASGLSLFRRGKRVFHHLKAARLRKTTSLAKARPLWYLPVLIFGLCGLGMVYFGILSPKNIAFDAHFYHLGLAQQYAVEGGIKPSPEGWLPAVIPHLASVLYAWCLTLPGLTLVEKMLCAAHLEFVIFLFTLASIPVLVRWLVPRAHVSLTWAAIFLFPGIWLYDSSLTTAADHIAAFWAIPIYLAFRRAWHKLDPRDCLLLSAMLAGMILTKYQAMYILVPLTLAILLRTLIILLHPLFKRVRKRLGKANSTADEDATDSRPNASLALRGLCVAAISGLVLTTPHWLKNWIWYGNPVFPYLSGTFPSARWVPDLDRLFNDFDAWQNKTWRPKGTLGARLLETLRALATFSFRPHDWPKFHGKVPVFGSLFTLSVLFLPFVRGAKRTWGLVIATHVGLFIWYWTVHQDRYLQLLLPWMVVVAAASITMAFRQNLLTKAFVSVLVGIQIVWGGDVYFIPGHAMTRDSPARVTSDLLAKGYQKKYDDRFALPSSLFTIGRSRDLPQNARILLHENNPRLGLWRPVVTDTFFWQYAFRYELFDSPAALDAKFRQLGITHVLTRAGVSRGIDALGADLRFFGYIHKYTKLVKGFGDMTLYRLVDQPSDTASPNNVVAYLGCNKFYEPGLHPIEKLQVREKQVQDPPPRLRATERASGDPAAREALVTKADFAVTDDKCKTSLPSSALHDFVQIATRGSEKLWIRRH